MAGTQNQPLEYEQVGYNAPDGMQMGRTTSDKIGFYGTTPIGQYTGVSAASTYNITSNTTSTVGFISVLELSSFISQVSSTIAGLKALGLFA